MAKQYKIKRYHKGGSMRARPHPITIILAIIVAAGLVFVGISIYQPVVNFIKGAMSGAGTTPSEMEPELDSAPLLDASEDAEDTAPPAKDKTNGLHIAYLPHETAVDPQALGAFLDQLEGTAINAVLVDIKNTAGTVLFGTKNTQVAQWGALAENPLDLAGLTQTLTARNLNLVVRLTAFRDPLSSYGARDMAVRYMDTEYLWLDAAADQGGQPWLNPYSQQARDYIGGLALEAAQGGASMVILENVQFPPYSGGGNATFGETGELSRQQILQQFVADLTQQLEGEGCRTALYATAISLSQSGDNETRYGGSPVELVSDTLVLGALPYQFGGNYDTEGLEITDPIANPGGAVEAMLAYLLDRSAGSGDFTVIPLLQGGTEASVNGASPYTKVQVDAQISAVEARGLDEYVLYTTDGNYALK